MLQEGQTVGPYQLLRRLGAGAFGEVWLARHVALAVERALKVPTDPDYVRQLRREGQLQFELHHPNIVKTFDLNPLHDPPYAVMEYVEGEDLRARLDREGKLPVDDALPILRQVLTAVEAAHARGVLHRDLKPGNVLLATDGAVKVADFGLGRVQANVARTLSVSGSLMTQEGKSIAGTVAYMSPEQQKGAAPMPSDDLYAVGIMGCELLTGSRPSGAGVAKEMARAGVPQEVVEVFDRACDTREYRYQSAGEMLAAVRDAEQALRARREAELRRTQEEARRREEERRQAEEADRQKAEARRREREQRQAAPPPVEVVSVPAQREPEAKRKPRSWALACVVILLLVAVGVALLVGTWTSRSEVEALNGGRPRGRTVHTQWAFDADEAKRRQAEAAKALGVEVDKEFELAPGVKTSMVLIPAGTFVIGSPKSEEGRGGDEEQKEVTIPEPFWMSKHQVTQAQWVALTGTNPSKFKGAKNPVESVSWNDIQEFLKKVNAHQRGARFSLPTEAQWEWACRAGTQTPFHFGDTISTDQANYDGNYTYGNGHKGVYRKKTVPVGSFPPNAWGLHDMHGNVWEWCSSPYSEEYDGSEQNGVEAESRLRVLRGGSWNNIPNVCRSANRYRATPTSAYSHNGFRVLCVARTLP